MDGSLAMLVEMFPNKPVDDLNSALQSSSGVIDDACLMLISEDNSKEDVNPNEELKTMFPLVEQATINSVWKDQDGNFDGSVAELLNHHMILEEKKNNDEAEPPIPLSPQGKSAPKSTVEIVQEYTGVSTSIARQFSYRSSFNVVKAIVSILDTHREPPTETKLPPVTRAPKRTGGRVQGAKGIAHSNRFASLAKEVPTQSSQDKPFYVYSSESSEARELEDAIQSNLDLKGIYPNFLHRALEYYRGDLLKTLQLATLILEQNGARYTYKDAVEGPVDLTGFSEYKPGGKSRPASKKSNEESGLTLEDDSYAPRAHNMLSNVLTNTRLDFHGFLCPDAIQVLLRCLNKWWKYELDQRELNNQKLSMSQVVNVEPLQVVTGRGIHSDNGVSKLKMQVRKFLEKNQYKYTEETSYFVVIGKKVR